MTDATPDPTELLERAQPLIDSPVIGIAQSVRDVISDLSSAFLGVTNELADAHRFLDTQAVPTASEIDTEYEHDLTKRLVYAWANPVIQGLTEQVDELQELLRAATGQEVETHLDQRLRSIEEALKAGDASVGETNLIAGMAITAALAIANARWAVKEHERAAAATSREEALLEEVNRLASDARLVAAEQQVEALREALGGLGQIHHAALHPAVVVEACAFPVCVKVRDVLASTPVPPSSPEPTTLGESEVVGRCFSCGREVRSGDEPEGQGADYRFGVLYHEGCPAAPPSSSREDEPKGLDAVREAVREARGGDAPMQPRGHA